MRAEWVDSGWRMLNFRVRTCAPFAFPVCVCCHTDWRPSVIYSLQRRNLGSLLGSGHRLMEKNLLWDLSPSVGRLTVPQLPQLPVVCISGGILRGRFQAVNQVVSHRWLRTQLSSQASVLLSSSQVVFLSTPFFLFPCCPKNKAHYCQCNAFLREKSCEFECFI